MAYTRGHQKRSHGGAKVCWAAHLGRGRRRLFRVGGPRGAAAADVDQQPGTQHNHQQRAHCGEEGHPPGNAPRRARLVYCVDSTSLHLQQLFDEEVPEADPLDRAASQDGDIDL